MNDHDSTPAPAGREPRLLGSRRITISTETATCDLDLSGRKLIWAGAVLLGLIAWMMTATAGFVVGVMGDHGQGAEVDMIEEAFEAKIASLEAALAAERGQASQATDRLTTALDQLQAQQGSIATALASQRDLSADLDEMRAKLAAAVDARDAAEARATELDTRLTALTDNLSGAEDSRDIAVILAAVSDALHTAVRDRDIHRNDLDRLQGEIATMELKMEISADRQEQMVAALEDAVQVSFKPLEGMFERTGLNVDTLIEGVRQSYSGIGGPETLVPASLPGIADPTLNSRFATLMEDMDRMNMLRIAAAKVPYAMPVHAAHRFTSGFGTRRDPKTGGRRPHNGIDLAGPRGTKIHSTADGVVVHAGWQSGFGKLVKIRHAYGFETLYAHLNEIHVAEGDRIARGDHIGDMGTTGRSTGVHLHYEVRLGGTPVNPMTYIKAAQDVF